jgi:hypothetical protein
LAAVVVSPVLIALVLVAFATVMLKALGPPIFARSARGLGFAWRRLEVWSQGKRRD